MTRMHRWSLLAAAAAAAVCLAPVPAAAAKTIELKTLSSRPDMASGGDAVVEVAVPADLALAEVVVKLNGADVTSAFVANAAGHKLAGLVAGLGLGNNTLRATSKRARGEEVQAGTLTILNFPATGPIFSGMRQSPWVCETAASGLGAPPASGPCTAPTRYDWFYRTTANTFVALPSTSPPYPADLATTTTVDGAVVPYIVRVESGVINESIYRIAILDDPANPISNPWKAGGKKPGAGWNGKLTYPFGGGASPAFRSGSNTVTSALQHDPLSLGFAVAFGTRNTYGTGADDVISAETLMMIKERFIEQYGVPKFTIGSGGSGGSIQQHYITQNYPGMLDALTPGISYSDLTSITGDVIDCLVLNHYFDQVANPASWPGTRRSAVDGYMVAPAGPNAGKTVCQIGWSGFADNWGNPTTGFSPVVPAHLIYNAVTNPTGIRGTFWDGNVNSFGKNPATNFARSPYDNVGIQYGLRAVNAGAITPEEFVHLNEHIGGIDIDGNVVPQRAVGDPIGLRRAYASGRVVTAFENMTLPIIDTRQYRDDLADIHTRHRTLVFLEKMQRANGTTANQVNWTTSNEATQPNLARMALLANNQWLENIAADPSGLPYATKVIKNKPSTLKDACWVNGTKIEEPISWDPNTACNQALPVHADVRLMAGGPVTGDVLACKLVRLDFSQYQVQFTADQQARLRAAFPNGVCDWSTKGRDQVPLSDIWIDFSKGRWGPANVYH